MPANPSRRCGSGSGIRRPNAEKAYSCKLLDLPCAGAVVDEGHFHSPNEPEPEVSLPNWLFAPAIRKASRLLFILWFCGVVMLGLWLVSRAAL